MIKVLAKEPPLKFFKASETDESRYKDLIQNVVINIIVKQLLKEENKIPSVTFALIYEGCEKIVPKKEHMPLVCYYISVFINGLANKKEGMMSTIMGSVAREIKAFKSDTDALRMTSLSATAGRIIKEQLQK